MVIRCPREIIREGKVYYYTRVTTKKGVSWQRKDWKKHKPYLKTATKKIGPNKYCFYVGGVGSYAKKRK